MTVEADVHPMHDLAHMTSTGPANADRALRRKQVEATLAAQTAGATGQFSLVRFPAACRLMGLRVIPQGAIAADGTDYVGMATGLDDGAGGTPTAIDAAIINTNSSGGAAVVGGVALVSEADTTPVDVAAGQYLCVTLTAGGSGKAIPMILFDVDYELV